MFLSNGMTLNGKRILLIISGGIAAYKSLELIRLIKKAGGEVRCILTEGGSRFITPLSVASLSGEKCYTDLWSLTDETEMGHIRLSREADLVVVAPASADIMAKLAHGMAGDLATTALLATNKPVMIAPAMNPCMWENTATQDNLAILKKRGIRVIDPASGEMACGEEGTGRMAEPEAILQSIAAFFLNDNQKPLAGKRAIVTSGPTYEPVDPVRFIGNRSSGRQGHAIAAALRDAGANVTLVTGPVSLPDPQGIATVHIETARQMLAAIDTALPADIAVCAAAVADWAIANPSPVKHKKGQSQPNMVFSENPDILKTLSNSDKRPGYVVGFAAETENTIENARKKLAAKGCDAIVANRVGDPDRPVFGENTTSVHWITKTVQEDYPDLSKSDVAAMICRKIAKYFNTAKKDHAA